MSLGRSRYILRNWRPPPSGQRDYTTWLRDKTHHLKHSLLGSLYATAPSQDDTEPSIPLIIALSNLPSRPPNPLKPRTPKRRVNSPCSNPLWVAKDEEARDMRVQIDRLRRLRMDPVVSFDPLWLTTVYPLQCVCTAHGIPKLIAWLTKRINAISLIAHSIFLMCSDATSLASGAVRRVLTRAVLPVRDAYIMLLHLGHTAVTSPFWAARSWLDGKMHRARHPEHLKVCLHVTIENPLLHFPPPLEEVEEVEEEEEEEEDDANPGAYFIVGKFSRRRQLNDISKEFPLLETTLGYKFKNKSLLREALTQSYFRRRYSYERLEFLGDSVLGYLISSHIYETYPWLDQEELTLLRSANVNNVRFAMVAVKHALYCHIPLASQQQLRPIMRFIESIKGDCNFILFEHLEYYRAPKLLGDIIESIAGAVFIDSGYSSEEVWKVMRPLLEPLVEPGSIRKHPVYAVLTLCKKMGKDIHFTDTDVKGKYTVEVSVDGKVVAQASGGNKEIVKRKASARALRIIEEELNMKNVKEGVDAMQVLNILYQQRHVSLHKHRKVHPKLLQHRPRKIQVRKQNSTKACKANS